MPTVRFMPTSAEYSYYNRCLERFMKGQQIETHGYVILSQLTAPRSCPSSSRRRRILCIIASSLCIVSLQNEINRKAITVFYPTQEMQIWDDEMFLKMFRFRREQFTELLKAFRLGNKSILCGMKGRRAQYFPADVCLMVVLRRFAFPCRFVDLVNIFGLPTHRICDIFHSTMKDTEAPPTYSRRSLVGGAATGWRRHCAALGMDAPRLDSCAAAWGHCWKRGAAAERSVPRLSGRRQQEHSGKAASEPKKVRASDCAKAEIRSLVAAATSRSPQVPRGAPYAKKNALADRMTCARM